MKTLRNFATYWWGNIRVAVETKEAFVSIASFFIAIVLWVMGPRGFDLKWLADLLGNPATLVVEKCAWFIAITILILWLPFRRQQKESEASLTTDATNRATIARLEERLRPKLEIECGPSIEGCCVKRSDNGMHLRMRVTLRGGQPVTGCKGTLIRITRSSDSVVVFNRSPYDLPFSPREDFPSGIATLYPDVSKFVLILFYLPAKGMMVIPRLHPPAQNEYDWLSLINSDGRYALAKLGSYLMEVAVSGDEIPTQKVTLILDCIAPAEPYDDLIFQIKLGSPS